MLVCRVNIEHVNATNAHDDLNEGTRIAPQLKTAAKQYL